MHLLSFAAAPHVFVSVAWVVAGALLTLGMIFGLWRWTVHERATARTQLDGARVEPPSDATP